MLPGYAVPTPGAATARQTNTRFLSSPDLIEQAQELVKPGAAYFEVIRPIPKGAQLFVDYGTCFCLHGLLGTEEVQQKMT